MNRPSASALLAFLLAACGGGAGGAPPAPPVAPPLVGPRVVAQPFNALGIDAVTSETGGTVLGSVLGTSYYVIEVPDGMTVQEYLDALRADARIVNADEDLATDAPEGSASTIPLFGDDPFAAVSTQPAVVQIGAPFVWSVSTGAGVRVAVVDTGISPGAPGLAAALEPDGFDFIDMDADPTDVGDGLDDDGDGRVDEGVGHGTFVASLVLAVAPGARIVPIRALGSDGVGSASSVANAIGYAVDSGCRVINLSLGLVSDLDMIRQAVEYARSAGVAVVAAAGNLGSSQVLFPAGLPGVEAVTSVDAAGLRAPFASFGSTVDLAAPGVDLIGSFPSPAGTVRWEGTSFSAAFVTGGFALLRQADPVSSSDQLLRRLEDTATDLGSLEPQMAGLVGKGRMNLPAALGP